MNEFMDTADPRLERMVPQRAQHRHVYLPRYFMWAGIALTLAIAALVAIVAIVVFA